MRFWPKSRTARRRLTVVLAVAPVLALAVGLTLFGMRDNISLFRTPAQLTETPIEPGRRFQLGGLVEMGSLKPVPGGAMTFRVTDNTASMNVVYDGEVTGLFREGQGVVAEGALREDGVFVARRVLAKHDEKYIPREVAKALKDQGEWHGEGQAREAGPASQAGEGTGGR